MRMLTDRGDLVVDPFAGSCVTGAVAETLERRWICCEKNEDYLKGAMVRFERTDRPRGESKSATYSLSSPCALPTDDEDAPLVENGGATRPESGGAIGRRPGSGPARAARLPHTA